MTLQKKALKPKSLLEKTLETLFKYPIVILMLGNWRMGKTDASLLIGHLAKKWGLIDKIGANIWTFNNPEVAYISNLGHLKRWLHRDKTTKLFLFDEALTHIPRRTAMSKKNVSMLKLLAELSKGHGRMIIISQINVLDKDILNPAFHRATFIKKTKKVMLCYSRHFGMRKFTDLPRSPIRFDADRLAPFTDAEMSKTEEKERGEVYRVALRYGRGHSMKTISVDLEMHPETVKRNIRKACSWFCEHQYDFPESIER